MLPFWDSIPSSSQLSRMLSVAIMALMLATCIPFSASKKARHVFLEEVADVWVGLTEDELTIYRLVLDPSGTGKGGFVYGAGEPVLFEISSWKYSKGRSRWWRCSQWKKRSTTILRSEATSQEPR